MKRLTEEELLKELLPEDSKNFPVGEGVQVIRGRTLTRTGDWFKAIVLVDSQGKKQIRLYGWQRNKEGVYKTRQKFNISPGYASIVKDILEAFSSE